MTTISVRLPESLLHHTDLLAHSLHIARGEYIRRAIEQMNREVLRQERTNRLKRASKLVRTESMIVNAEFEQIEHDPQA